MVKWPNDIFIKKKKLVGILLESVKTEKTTSFVLGIGMNILSAPKLQHSQYEPTSIAELTDKIVNSNDIIFDILKSILSATKNFQKLRINEFKRLWNKYDLLADKRVTVESENNKFCGIARGIGNLGELLVETDDGKMLQFYSGKSKIVFSETFIV
jgi:BirA family biotin operon repressor/biotin-[acetyl-CoA-carboxylase] ligase